MQVGKIWPSLAFPVLVYISWRLIICLFLILETGKSLSFTIFYQLLYWPWVRFWDSGHYISIAQNGYHFPQQAFWPLWPWLIKAFYLLGLPAFEVSFVLSSIFSLAAFIIFYILTRRLMGLVKARLALVIFSLFPSSMFLLTSYSESLFLTLVLLSFWLIEKKIYFWSSLIAGLAGATRLVGLGLISNFLSAPRPLVYKVGYICLSLSGIGCYMAYLYFKFGDPFFFIQAEKDWCHSSGRCGFTFPLLPLIDFINLVVGGRIIIELSPQFLDGISGLIFLALSYLVLRILGVSYFIYNLIAILLPLSSGSIVGMTRYCLAAWPVFLVMTTFKWPKWLFFIFTLLLFFLQLHFISLFIHQVWID